jgi:ChrR Cupin-like domain
MEGVFEDEHAEFAAGSYVRNPSTSRHTPWLGIGVTLFVGLWQFALADRKHVVLGTASSAYRATTDRPGVELMPLFQPNNSMLRCASTNATQQIKCPPASTGFSKSENIVLRHVPGQLCRPFSRRASRAASGGGRRWFRAPSDARFPH